MKKTFNSLKADPEVAKVLKKLSRADRGTLAYRILDVVEDVVKTHIVNPAWYAENGYPNNGFNFCTPNELARIIRARVME